MPSGSRSRGASGGECAHPCGPVLRTLRRCVRALGASLFPIPMVALPLVLPLLAALPDSAAAACSQGTASIKRVYRVPGGILELDLKVERSPQMWHFPVDFHTRQGGPHGLERDHSRAV